MSWFDKLLPNVIRTEGSPKKAVPEGLWNKCTGCGAILYRAEMERNMDVCPKCGFHNRIGAKRRLDLFLDPDNRVQISAAHLRTIWDSEPGCRTNWARCCSG